MTISPKNILFVQVDQLTPATIPVYGNAIAKAPNLSSLASGGTVFDFAYCNSPLCYPSRSSMMSGKLPSEIEAFDNGSELPASVPTFAHYLRRAGYQTSLSGKMHFVGPDQLHGFEERLTTDIYPADFSWTGDWNSTFQEHNNDTTAFTQAGPCVRNPQIDYDEEVLHRAKRKLFNLARSSDPRPFLLVASFTQPHDPYQCEERFWDLYRDEDIDMPIVSAIPFDEQDPYTQRLLTQYRLRDFTPTQEQIKRVRRAYYGMISYVDEAVGVLLQTLKSTGLDKDTIVIFTSDHGEMLGERGLWYKRCLYEHSARVPLIVRHPEFGAGIRVKENVSLIDLLPTMLELADPTGSLKAVDKIIGQSIVPCLKGIKRDEDTTFVECLFEGAGAAIMMVKKGSYKLITSLRDPEQLFDLSTDPKELTNLLTNPSHADKYEELKSIAEEQWDLERIESAVLLSQCRRKFVHRALTTGAYSPWDFVPIDQASEQCLRGGYAEWLSTNTLGSRFS